MKLLRLPLALLVALTVRIAFAQMCNDDLIQVGHGHRDRAAYAVSMDHVLLQKMALAYFVRSGSIVDFGCGSGSLARALALIFPGSRVVGVDLDPGMIGYANDQPHPENVTYRVGNVLDPLFADGTVDTVLLSATIHHLPAYGRRRFDIKYVHDALEVLHRQLRFGGHLVLRDFIYPDGPEFVSLDLPTDDGANEGPVVGLSTAALFRVFARDFRSAQHPDAGFTFESRGTIKPGWERFYVNRRDATEFIHHKDYRENWEGEILEPYMLFTQGQIEQVLRDHGFRLLHFTPISNDWIVDRRFVGKYRMTGPDGALLPFPATGFGAAAQKIRPGEGARFIMTEARAPARPYLREFALRDRTTKKVYDIVHRPYTAVDVLPYFLRDGSVFVLGKQGFPRPILTRDGLRPLGGTRGDGYVTEPFGFIRRADEPLFTEIERELDLHAGVRPNQILSAGPGRDRYVYPSPSMTSEVVRMVAVPIRSRRVSYEIPHENYSGFSSSGTVRSLEATSMLRGAQLGSSLDARIEIAIYNLLLDLGRSRGPWIGDAIAFPDEDVKFPVRSAESLLHPRRRARRFEEAPRDTFGRFLKVTEGRFAELDLAGREIAHQWLEFVEPRDFGQTVISVLPVIRRRGRYYVGVEHRHLPTVQMSQGFSDFIDVPAWRIPKAVEDLTQARKFVRDVLKRDFGLTAGRLRPLGGGYHPSTGLSDEAVHPYVATIDPRSVAGAKLSWVSLEDLLSERDAIRDANLLISVFRLAHALGVRPRPVAQ